MCRLTTYKFSYCCVKHTQTTPPVRIFCVYTCIDECINQTTEQYGVRMRPYCFTTYYNQNFRNHYGDKILRRWVLLFNAYGGW